MEAGLAEYLPKEQSDSLLHLALGIPFARSIVGLPERRGLRYVFVKFIAVETYLCFEEPTLEPWRGLRFVFWRTLHTTKKPKSWSAWKGLIRIGSTYAVGHVHPQYRGDWEGNARRAAQKHEKESTVLQRVSLKEFASAYHHSRHIDPLLRHGMIRVAQDHLRTHPEDVFILLAYTQTGKLGGGAVFVDYPEICASHYITSFLTPLGRKNDFGYAYIDWWYQHMLERTLTYAEFGFMWQPGDPLGWKGSTAFKARFKPTLYSYARYLRVTQFFP